MGLEEDGSLKDYLVFNYEWDVRHHFRTGSLDLVQMQLRTNEITSLANQSFNLQLSVDSDREFVYLVEEGTTKYFRVYLEYLVKSYVAEVEKLVYE